MTYAEEENLGGRVNAHRELLVEILSILIAQDRQVEERLSTRSGDLSVSDQQEDPGGVPTEAFAEEAKFSDEMRSILADANARMQARRRLP